MVRAMTRISTLTLASGVLASVMVFSGFSELCEAAPKKGMHGLRVDYQRFLDNGRTPRETLKYTLENSTWRTIDPSQGKPEKLRAGERVVFVNQGRTALYVVIGKASLEQAGASIIASHIDTPSPRLFLGALKKGQQSLLTAGAHGGIKGGHWLRRPLAMVGQVVKANGTKVDVQLGASDDFAFFIESRGKGSYQVRAASVATSKSSESAGVPTFVGMMNERYGVNADDLRSAELYLVPKQRARAVGAESMMVGAHGQDDRANSYLAWKSVSSIKGVPRRTAIAWLVDREESGSRGRAGARSRFLELVYSYLLRSQGGAVTEARLHRAFAASEALSADTPACVNPNWPEVHESKHGPILGRGPAVFPSTGRGGKHGGSQANAESIAKVLAVFARAKVPVQTAEIGRVDEGGGGTIAKDLAHRGIDTVDLGVCVVAMHSPFEISSVRDLWLTLRGFRYWLLH